MGQEYKGANCVCHDDYKAAYTAEKLMLDKGCKKPAFIGVTEQDKAAGQARKDGFLHALSDNGINIEKSDMQTAEFKNGLRLQKGFDITEKRQKVRPHFLCHRQILPQAHSLPAVSRD